MADIQAQAKLIQQLADEWRFEDVKEILKEFEIWVNEKVWDDGKQKIVTWTDWYLQLLKDRMTGMKNDSIIPTWFKCIDDRIFGAVKWNIMTICARTWWGKTTLWLNIALNICKTHKVWFISLEMTEEEIWDKIVSSIASIDNSSLCINEFTNDEKQRIVFHIDEIKYALNNIERAYDCYDIDSICSVIEKMADNWCEVIFVDWLWMIEANGNAQFEKTRVIMRELKRIAITKNVAIVAMQQLNRQMDWTNRAPYLYDIADWSSIEKISSPVIILWRAEEWKTEVSFYKTRRLNSRKFRNPTTNFIDYENLFSCQLQNELQYSRFVDLAEEDKKDNVNVKKEDKPF